MNLKEHLQFVLMMIPTLLLAGAAIVTLILPANGTAQATAADQTRPQENLSAANTAAN